MSVAVSGAAAAAPGPSVPGDVLALLYQHRLLSTRQVHLLHRPDGSRRSAERVLAGLRERGLAEFTRARSSVTAESLWYCSDKGARVAEGGARGRERAYRMTADQAVGRLRAHTLAVNEVGLALVTWARSIGDECGPYDWEHEIGFQVSERRRRGQPMSDLCVPDAVLHYTRAERGGDVQPWSQMVRFVEVDRCTETTETLRAKLRVYAQLRAFKPARAKGGSLEPGGWRARFLVYPKVLVVFCDASPVKMAAHRDRLLSLCSIDPVIKRAAWAEADPLVVTATTLPELIERGPFAPIFWTPWEDGPRNMVGE